MRTQTCLENKGIVDRDPNNLDRSISRIGYVHHSGTEFSPELIGNFGNWIEDFVGDSLVVELGCGSAVLSQYCERYIGLDGNNDAGNYCEGEFFSVDLTAPYDFDPPVQANVLLSFDFMEHIEEDLIVPLLKQADKLLVAGAKIFLEIDSRPIMPEHITLKTPEWWDSQIEQTGWVKETITDEFRDTYFNNLPIHWNSAENPRTFQMLFLYRKPGIVKPPKAKSFWRRG